MEGLKLIPYIALIFTIVGVIIGASVITLNKFGDTIDTCYNSSYTYNSSLDKCVNATRNIGSYGYGRNFSNEYWTVWNSMDSEVTIAEQQPTVAIIAVMVIIISVLAGIFVYMRYFG